jgi:predicted metal-dependent hydrolase
MPIISKIIRSKRKTIALVIQPNGDLLVRAPQRATKKQINAMVDEHAKWIAKKQAKAIAAQAVFAPHQFRAGESFSFLGENYSLQFVRKEKPIFDLNGNFQLAQSANGQAEQIFEKWYKQQARRVFTDRIEFYAE